MTNAPKCGHGLNGRTNERTSERTTDRTDGQFDFLMPQLLFGGIKIKYIHCCIVYFWPYSFMHIVSIFKSLWGAQTLHIIYLHVPTERIRTSNHSVRKAKSAWQMNIQLKRIELYSVFFYSNFALKISRFLVNFLYNASFKLYILDELNA